LVSSFESHLPVSRPAFFILTSDCQTAALLTYEKGEPLVKCHDVATGRILCRFLGCRGPMVFSRDGRQLAAARGSSVVVFDVPTSREIGQLDSPEAGLAWPIEFSPDGNLLLDSHCNVWDLRRNIRRFGVQDIYSCCCFTEDAHELIVVATSGSESWLAYYDASTGNEEVERRVRLLRGQNPRTAIRKATPDGQWLVAEGNIAGQDEPWSSRLGHLLRPLESWIAKVRLFLDKSKSRSSLGFILVETATGREIMRSEHQWLSCSPEQRCVVIRNGLGDLFWDLPPRKSLPGFLTPAAIWCLSIGLLTRWRVRRRRRML